MTETTRLEDSVSEEQLTAYRKKLASARKRAPVRATGPAHANMPTVSEMEAMADRPEGGDIQLSGKEISELARTPSPTPRLSVPGSGSPLKKETIEGLQAVAKATQEAEEAAAEEAADEEDAEGPDADEDIASMRSLLSGRRDGALTQVRTIFNAARRKQIEEKLTAIDIALVLTNQDVVQKVEIASGAVVTFRSMNGLESEFVPRFIWDRYKGELTYEMNELAKSLVSLTLCVVGVGGRDIVEHRNKKGSVHEPSFEQKWEALLKYPGFLLEAMDINRVWFLERCADSLKVADLGNG